jgi:DNA-binding protein Fis
VEELERRLLADALQRCRGNQVQAAKLLGLSRQGLIKKIARYGLKSSPG